MTVNTINVSLSGGNSNPGSAGSIRGEFGLASQTTSVALSQYYRGGARVPGGTANGGFGLIATSGTISMGTFRNTSAATTINLTISSNTLNYNIRTAAGNPAGVANVTVTINSGVLVGSGGSFQPAFTTGTGWVAGSTITVVNNGTISGYGGDNGAIDNSGAGVNGNGFTGGTGGTAVTALFATTFTNNGIVAGGGGQGGFGGNGSVIGGANGYGGRGGQGAFYLVNASTIFASGSGSAGGGAGGTGGVGGVGGFSTIGAPNFGGNGGSNNSSGGGGAGGGLGAGGGAAATAGAAGGRGKSGATLTSNGGAGGAGGLRLSGLSFVNGGAGITGGTLYGSQS